MIFSFPRRALFICFIGIDGSGKTTLSQRLVAHLKTEFSGVRYVHSFHSPIFLKPLKLLAKLTLMRKTDQFGDYLHYKETKSERRKRHRIMSRIYGAIWILDYSIQSLLKVAIPCIFSKVLVVDRYIFDVAINLSLTMDASEQSIWKRINLLLKINPKPDMAFLVDVPQEIAFARKNDIPHIEYLRERRAMYLNVASKFNMHILDGTNSIEELSAGIIRTLKDDSKTNTHPLFACE